MFRRAEHVCDSEMISSRKCGPLPRDQHAGMCCRIVLEAGNSWHRRPQRSKRDSKRLKGSDNILVTILGVWLNEVLRSTVPGLSQG